MLIKSKTQESLYWVTNKEHLQILVICCRTVVFDSKLKNVTPFSESPDLSAISIELSNFEYPYILGFGDNFLSKH